MVLSKKELLYLTALMGANNLWGIEDAFAEMSEEEIRSELLRLQDSLLRKQFLEVDADRPFEFDESSVKLLRHCIESTRVYILNSSHMEKKEQQMRFFVKEKEVAFFRCREQAELISVSPNEMRSIILSFFGNGDYTEISSTLTVGVTRLRRMGSLSRQHFLQELHNSGCSDDLALLIADSLQGSSDFCSLMAYERENGKESYCGKLVTLRFSGGSLMVTNENDPDIVCFKKLSRETLLSEIERLAGREEDVEVI